MSEITCHPRSRFLLVRPDRIGDLILTLPAISALREKYPQSLIAVLASSYAAPLLQNHPAVDLVLENDETQVSFWNLVKKIEAMQFDVSIHFFSEKRSSLAAALAKVPVRVGPFSRWPSIFFTQRIFQNRSSVQKHEAEYNLDLAGSCGAEIKPYPPKIYLTGPEKQKGREMVTSLLKNSESKPILIHPGSKGSAQSWPLDSFLELAKKCAEDSQEVLVTCGEGEEMILNRVREMSHPHIHLIPRSLSLREFASVLAQGKIMISNSTGPLHMAVALGLQTLSFYPQWPAVTSSKRWGPYPPSGMHRVLSPAKERDPLSSITVE
ncbi:MAG: glycosyltransferase family 9 protein, partial [Elusimicrobia bacterium]|nr:glycosyltransferase family 9 protein [Elusimicrobiota bacterium]